MFWSFQALSHSLWRLLPTLLLCQSALAAGSKQGDNSGETQGPSVKEGCFTRQELAVRGGGFLVRVVAGEGNAVKKGDLIAELDNRVLKAAKKEAGAGVLAAKAMLALASDGWERLEKLSKSDTVAPSELFGAQIQVEKAKAQLMQAEAVLERVNAQLDDTRIVAELDGKVSGLPHVKGLYIQPGQSLGHVEVTTKACNF